MRRWLHYGCSLLLFQLVVSSAVSAQSDEDRQAARALRSAADSMAEIGQMGDGADATCANEFSTYFRCQASKLVSASDTICPKPSCSFGNEQLARLLTAVEEEGKRAASAPVPDSTAAPAQQQSETGATLPLFNNPGPVTVVFSHSINWSQGNAHVVSSPPGIDCPPTCSASFSGVDLRLTAQADSNSIVSDVRCWADAGQTAPLTPGNSMSCVWPDIYVARGGRAIVVVDVAGSGQQHIITGNGLPVPPGSTNCGSIATGYIPCPPNGNGGGYTRENGGNGPGIGPSGGSGIGGGQQNSGNPSGVVYSNLCIRFENVRRGNNCNDPSSISYTVRNVCNQVMDLRFCNQRQNGSWDCGMDSNTRPSGSTSDFTCHATGRYEGWARTPSPGFGPSWPTP